MARAKGPCPVAERRSPPSTTTTELTTTTTTPSARAWPWWDAGAGHWVGALTSDPPLPGQTWATGARHAWFTFSNALPVKAGKSRPSAPHTVRPSTFGRNKCSLSSETGVCVGQVATRCVVLPPPKVV
jgi:hypothetical protein